MISHEHVPSRLQDMGLLDDLTLRLARPEDAVALGRLAQLDDTLYDGAPVLVADVGGELVAALPLAGGAPFADPFRRTGALVALLRLRLDQLAAAGQAELGAAGLIRARRAGRRLRRYHAPA